MFIQCLSVYFMISLAYHAFGISTPKPVVVNPEDLKCIPTRVDIALVVDSSGSVEDVFNSYKKLALEMANLVHFDKKTSAQLAIIQYSKFATLKYGFGGNQTDEEVFEALDSMTFLGDTTRTADAIHLAVDELSRNGRKEPSPALGVVVVMTDGNSFDAWDTSVTAAKELEKLGPGTKKIFVAMGASVYEPELKLYAKKDATIFRSGETAAFKKLMGQLTGNCPPPPRSTKAPILPKIVCPHVNKLDLVLIVDSSGSVDSVFNAYKKQCLELCKKLSISVQGTRISLVQYSRSPAQLLHQLDDPQTNVELFKSATSMNFLGDTTHTADAVHLAVEHLGKFGRPDARRIVALMTDGNSFDAWSNVAEASQSLHKMVDDVKFGGKVYVVAYGDIVYLPEIKLYAGPKGVIIRNGEGRRFEEALYAASCLDNGTSSAEAAKTGPPSATPATTKKPVAARLQLTSPKPQKTLTVVPASLAIGDLVQSAAVTQKSSTIGGDSSGENSTNDLTSVDRGNSALTLIPGSNLSDPFGALPTSRLALLRGADNESQPASNLAFSTNFPQNFTEIPRENLSGTINKTDSTVSQLQSKFVAPVTLAPAEFFPTTGSPDAIALEIVSARSTIHREKSSTKIPLGRITQRQKKSESGTKSGVEGNSILEPGASSDVKSSNGPAEGQAANQEPSFVAEGSIAVDNAKILQPIDPPKEKAITTKKQVILPIVTEAAKPQETEAPRTTPKVTLPPVPLGCAADILFILDASGSVLRDFQRQINFMHGVVDRLTVDPSAHQVAVLEYSGPTRQRLQISFKVYNDRETLKSAIDALPFFSGTTSTGEALSVARRTLSERRPGVALLTLVVTDGFSQDDVSIAASSLRNEPNSQLYAVGLTEPVDKLELIKIGGDENHVLTGFDPVEIASRITGKIPSCSGFGLRAQKIQ